MSKIQTIATSVITAALFSKALVLEDAKGTRNSKDGIVTVVYGATDSKGQTLGVVKRALGKEHGENNSFTVTKQMAEDGKSQTGIVVTVDTTQGTENWKPRVEKAPARVTHSSKIVQDIKDCLAYNKEVAEGKHGDDAQALTRQDVIALVKMERCGEGGLKPQMAAKYLSNNLAKHFEGEAFPEAEKPAKEDKPAATEASAESEGEADAEPQADDAAQSEDETDTAE